MCISCFRIISHIQLESYIHMQTNKTPVINLYVNMYKIYICVCVYVYLGNLQYFTNLKQGHKGDNSPDIHHDLW